MTSRKPAAKKAAGPTRKNQKRLQPYRWIAGPDSWDNAIRWAQWGNPELLVWRIREEGVPPQYGAAIAALIVSPPAPMAPRPRIDPQAAAVIRAEYHRLLIELKNAEAARAELGKRYHVAPDTIKDICLRRKAYRSAFGYGE